ncbi:MAG: hypothetical protein JEZ06_11110 [Anaerolineaceae bacterium]|nr:hypothetical protein [Anaerolineaceae bacterium]
MNPNPFTSFLRANLNFLRGRYCFPKERIGEIIEYEGQNFTIFREMFVDSGNTAEPQAVFKVRFHVENMTPGRNMLFSRFTIPFFSGIPGFRSKLWLLDEKNGDNMGIYEWATPDDAHAYSQSFAMKFMAGRSTPGSAKFEIITK